MFALHMSSFIKSLISWLRLVSSLTQIRHILIVFILSWCLPLMSSPGALSNQGGHLTDIFVSLVDQAHARTKRKVSKGKLDLGALRNQGKSLYKQKDYRGAELLFIKLVQHNSTNAKDYTFLARSAMRAQNFVVASVAYLIYFDLTQRPKAKLRNEYKEASKHINKGMDKRKLKAHHGRLEEVLHLIKDGQLSGDRGALAAINDLHRDKVFHPLMNRAHQRFKSQILKRHEQLVNQLLYGGTPHLKDHQNLIRRWGSRSWGDYEASQRALNTLKVLSQLKSRPEMVLKGLRDLEQAGVELPKSLLRQLQLSALIALNRADEVYMMADGLIQQVPSEPNEARAHKRLKLLHLLRGIYGQKLPREARVDKLVEMMSIPSHRARSALKIEGSSLMP